MKIYLAPLEGITTSVYRTTYAKYYDNCIEEPVVDKYFIPFLEPHVKIGLPAKTEREILRENNIPGKTVPQIITNDAEGFLFLSDHILEQGYTEINLNLGCPSATVVNKGRGSGFLEHLDELDRFLDTIFTRSKVPLSIKTRIGRRDPEEIHKILDLYRKYPLAELIIHPRTRDELYKGPIHIECLREAFEKMPFPVVYNGDINTVSDYAKILQLTGAVSVDIMCGRGLIANPELAASLKQFERDKASADDPDVFIQSKAIQSALFIENDPVPLSKKKLPAVNLFPASASGGVEQTDFDFKKFAEFQRELCEKYDVLYGGGAPVMHRMKELWVYWSSIYPDAKKLLKSVHKTKNASDYKKIMEVLS